MTEATYTFKQRIPAFIDSRGFTPIEFDFNTVEELKQQPIIQHWLRKPSSYLCKETSGNLLMVVEDEGFTNWCIGWITNSDKLNLPIHVKKTILQYSDGRIEIKTQDNENPVVLWRGNTATLKDGTKCKIIRYEDWKK